jgi:hypothetical protein
MNEKVRSSVERCVAVENMLDDMGRNISKDIYAAVRKATSNVVKGPGGGINLSPNRLASDTALSDSVGIMPMANDNVKHMLNLKAD